MENVHYAIAAVILFVSFYLVAMLIHTIWSSGQDDDE